MQRILTSLIAVLIGFSANAAQTNRPAAQSIPPKAQPAKKTTATQPPAASSKPKAAPAPAAASTAADDRIIGTIMDKFETAVKSGDFTYAIEVMYAPVLNQIGGKAQALTTAKAVQEQMKAQKISYLSWKAQKPYTYVDGTTHRYAVIRYEALFDAAGQKLKIKNSLLGIKVSNTTWQFIMGDDVNPAFCHQFLPDLPNTFVMPRPQTIKL